MFQRFRFIVASLMIAFVAAACGLGFGQDDGKSYKDELPRIPATEPADAARAFKLLDGLRIELVAAEPLVTSPVDMAFDEDGRIWVVEMNDYPYGPAEGNEPQGRVKMLEDTDDDGRMDRATVLIDKLAWPTGLALWDGGCFVAVAPEVLYIKDTDGDGTADVREVVFSGFGKQNVQALLNNIKWGLENWFYAASGPNGGTIRSPRQPDAEPLNLSGRDFRFRASGEIEPLSGGGQFGHSMDDFGQRFICSNSVQARHIVLEHRYLSRNPALPVPAVAQSIATDGDSGPVFRLSPAEPWRVVRTRLRIAGKVPGPIEHGGKVTGYFTSATGITVYRGTALGDDFYGNLFIGDVASNLVHRKRLTSDGVTFRADRVEKDREFLATPDTWFRPCNFANGPDGALYICDIYREVVEHPASIPEIIKQHLDLTSGRDRGRIWRVTRDRAAAPERPALSKATASELAAALGRPDAWWRETAARLIFERQDKSATPALEKLTRHERPETRVAALWALDGLDALTTDRIKTALDDAEPLVREQAIRLAEKRLKSSPELTDRLLALAGDSHPRVSLQLAETLGEIRDARSIEPLARLAVTHGADLWIRTAVLSSVGDAADSLNGRTPSLALLETMLGQAAKQKSESVSPEMLSQLIQLIARRNNGKEIAAALKAILGESGDPVSRWATLRGLGEGLRTSKQSLAALLDARDGPLAQLTPQLRLAFDDASRAALDASASDSVRIAAVQLMAYAPPQSATKPLASLLTPRHSQPVQLAAVRAMSLLSDPAVASLLLEPWRSYSPPVRREVVEALFSRPERLALLLHQLESGQVRRADLDPDRKKQLLAHKDAKLRERAEKLLAGDLPGDRNQVIAAYRPALERPADPARGQAVFKKHCVTCHKLGGEGHEVGPDLATVKERTPDALLEQILDPNREVNPTYINYNVATSDGRILTGMIASESANSITLKRAEGASDTVLRSQIEELISTGLSLMPEGLEKEITPEQLADVIAFLREGAK